MISFYDADVQKWYGWTLVIDTVLSCIVYLSVDLYGCKKEYTRKEYKVL